MNCATIEETLHSVAKGELYAPPEFIATPLEVLDTICNGCGAAGSKFDFVPDTMYGVCMCSVCNLHDFMYFKGKTIEDKEEADRVMLNNFMRIINKVKGWRKLFRIAMRRRAIKYYEAVHYCGGPAFWEGKNDC